MVAVLGLKATTNAHLFCPAFPHARARKHLAMDSIYQLRYRDVLMLCVMALLALGVIMVQSAASGVTGSDGWHWSTTGIRDLMYVGAALVAFFICGFIDYRWIVGPRADSTTYSFLPPIHKALAAPAVWTYLIGVGVCVAVLIPGIGKTVNGAQRWIQLGPIQLQSSEVGKWGCVLLFAWLLSTAPQILKSFKGFILLMVPLGIIGILVVKEDFGTAALIGLCSLMIVLAGGVRLWHMGVMVPPLAAGALYFIVSEPYRLKRIAAFVDPFANPEHEGYHLIQSLLSFASGGVLGKGLGNGIQKLGYLPEDTTDFIFAVICEELGLAGAALTVLLYLGILWACWNIMRVTKDPFGRLLTFGVGCMIGLQAMLNIAVATVSVPPKGLPLPLVSFGGTGLVITSAMLGLVYSVARRWENKSGVSSLEASTIEMGSHTA